MQFWELVFLLSCLLIIYNYGGYALIAYTANKIAKRPKRKIISSNLPSISFIVPAYNEEQCIVAKIENSLSLNYPADRIEFVFIADGSTDDTVTLISRFPSIRLLFSPERGGKSAALNRAADASNNEILVISDANTVININALIEIAQHYSDGAIGGVAGEKKVLDDVANCANKGGGEGLYWKYESTLKAIDSEFHSVVGAAGELFSVRKNLFEHVGSDVILDDFIISLKVAQKGYRVVYEPNAYATELPSFSIKDEKKRKVRIAAGGFQSIFMMKSLLKFWRHPKLTYLYISHRVMRWTTSPLCLITAFVSNLILVLSFTGKWFILLFLIQLLFYSLAAIGSLSIQFSHKKAFRLPFYFVFMNVSVILGLFKYLNGNQSAIWEKAKRSQGALTIK